MTASGMSHRMRLAGGCRRLRGMDSIPPSRPPYRETRAIIS